MYWLWIGIEQDNIIKKDMFYKDRQNLMIFFMLFVLFDKFNAIISKIYINIFD